MFIKCSYLLNMGAFFFTLKPTVRIFHRPQVTTMIFWTWRLPCFCEKWTLVTLHDVLLSWLTHTHTHLTRRFPLCRSRRWAQRHTGTSARIPPLTGCCPPAHIHTHKDRHTHGSQPWTWCPCLAVGEHSQPVWVFVRGGLRGDYTSRGADLTEMTLLVGAMTFYRKEQCGRETKLTQTQHTHTQIFKTTSGQQWKQLVLLYETVGCSVVVLLSGCVNVWGRLSEDLRQC